MENLPSLDRKKNLFPSLKSVNPNLSNNSDEEEAGNREDGMTPFGYSKLKHQLSKARSMVSVKAESSEDEEEDEEPSKVTKRELDDKRQKMIEKERSKDDRERTKQRCEEKEEEKI